MHSYFDGGIMKKVYFYLFILINMCFLFFIYTNFTYSFCINRNIRCYFDFKQEIRYEYWDTFDKKYSQDNFRYNRNYGFTSSKMRLGAGFASSILDGYCQLNWTQFFSLPDDAEFGLGSLYYKFNGHFGGPNIYPDKAQNIGYMALSQFWIRFKPFIINGLKLKIGRFLYFSGLEGGIPKNENLKWVKKLRISQRMIGPFDWSRVGRAFDGIMASYDHSFWNFTVSYMHPTPGGFYLKRDDWRKNGKSSHRIDIITAALSIKDTNPYLSNVDTQLFYYYYNDNRQLFSNVKIINGHDYTAELDGLGDCEIHMIGGHAIYVYDIGPGTMDFLLWGGYQWGNWGRGINGNDHVLTHDAWAIAIETGYNFKNVLWKPWLRIGYFYGTGDNDPDDKKHNTFFMMIPTLRIYSLTPSYTFMNTHYIMGQIIIKPYKKVLLRSDVHFVSLTESKDFWYLGSGIMRPDKDSYAPISAHINREDKDLLSMWDISVFIKDVYHINKFKIGLDFYISHIWGGDVIKDAFKAHNELTFFYAEVRMTFK